MQENIPTHLIVRYLSNEATAEEKKKLLDWVAEDASHHKVFLEWLTLWENKTPRLAEPDLSHALRQLNDKIDIYEEEEKKTRTLFSWRKLAASIAVFLVAGIAIYLLGKYSESRSEKITYTQQAASSGEQISIKLSDGSVVQLNAQASLKYPETFKGFKREVYLTGEAFFEIEKDSLRPFIIHTGEFSTHVLGTSFNVNATGDNIVVSVASGKVRVMQGDEMQILLPEEKVRYSHATKIMVKEKANLERELAWKNNTLIFEDTRLADASKKIEQWYGVSVSFQNEEIKHCLITGKYKNEPVDKVLQAISYSTGIQYRITGKTITLYGKGCE
jgi:ferric-dicitrate binding protein FerR (iron transport regulator)